MPFMPVHEPVPSVPVKAIPESTPVIKPDLALESSHKPIPAPTFTTPAHKFAPKCQTCPETTKTSAQRRRLRKKKQSFLAPAPESTLVSAPAPESVNFLNLSHESAPALEFSNESVPAPEFSKESTPFSEFCIKPFLAPEYVSTLTPESASELAHTCELTPNLPSVLKSVREFIPDQESPIQSIAGSSP